VLSAKRRPEYDVEAWLKISDDGADGAFVVVSGLRQHSQGQAQFSASCPDGTICILDELLRRLHRGLQSVLSNKPPRDKLGLCTGVPQANRRMTGGGAPKERNWIGSAFIAGEFVSRRGVEDEGGVSGGRSR
jgi:hypothetical protein